MRKTLAVLPLLFVCLFANAADRKYIVDPRPGDTKALPFSDAVLVGNTLYIAGHIGLDPKTGQAPADAEAGSPSCDGRHQEDGRGSWVLDG